jgi:hypothetical protein
MILQPWHLLVMALAGWLNRQQQAAIEYLREEKRVLREKLGRKRILLSNDLRRRLAIQGKALGRKLLSEIACFFTPDTILAWHRKLIANKYDGSRNRGSGRTKIEQNIRELILQRAREDLAWGYTRSQGALAGPASIFQDTQHQIAKSRASHTKARLRELRAIGISVKRLRCCIPPPSG